MIKLIQDKKRYCTFKRKAHLKSRQEELVFLFFLQSPLSPVPIKVNLIDASFTTPGREGKEGRGGKPGGRPHGQNRKWRLLHPKRKHFKAILKILHMKF